MLKAAFEDGTSTRAKSLNAVGVGHSWKARALWVEIGVRNATDIPGFDGANTKNPP